MGITPLTFTGVSQYSDDFQTILNRAVSIASIPVRQMQNQQADLLSKKQLLTDLGSSVSSLADIVSELGQIGATRSLTAASSNANRVAVTNDGATVPASYTISEITSIATAASERTVNGYQTPDQSPVANGDMELVLGSGPGSTIPLTLAAGKNNLNGLAEAINGLNAGVAATVLNTGTGDTPYYLSLTALSTGATTLQLRLVPGDAGSNILTAANQGSDAVFKLNGLDVRKPDNVITGVIPNVALAIESTTSPNETVTISLSSDRSRLATSLAGLVDSYNAVVKKLNAQIGPAAGLLSGDSIVREVQQRLRSLMAEQGTGAVNSLADLGIELDKNGSMSFDSYVLYSLSDAQVSSAFDFLGSDTSGLGSQAAALRQISDPIGGMIHNEQAQFDATDKRLGEQIDALNERIDTMQHSLSEKLTAADVLLASLASQQNLLDASLQGLNLVMFGRKQG